MATKTRTRSCIAIKKTEAFGSITGRPGSKLGFKITPLANDRTRFKVQVSRLREHRVLVLPAAPPPPGDGRIPLSDIITGFLAGASCVAGIYVVYTIGRTIDCLSQALKNGVTIKSLHIRNVFDCNLPVGRYLLIGSVLKKKQAFIFKRLVRPCLKMLGLLLSRKL